MPTTTMNISLPDTMKSFVEERLQTEGYGTASEYIRELIRADQKKKEQEKLETLLVERLQSNNVTDFNILKLKETLADKLAQTKK